MDIQEQIREDDPETLITVTEEKSEITEQDVSESFQDTKQVESDINADDVNVKDPVDTEDDSQTLKAPDVHTRKESTLNQLDKKHAWLSELENKCINLQTAFMSKVQYVAISNHCQKYLDELSSDESLVRFRVEFSNLFEKFRTAFTGSQQLLNKLQECKGYSNIANAEIRKLKIKLEDKNRKIEHLQEHLDRTQNDLLEVRREKAALQRTFSEWQEEGRKDDKFKEEEETDSKFVTDESEEAQEKIKNLEEQLEFVNKELEFTKQRETQSQNRFQRAENQKNALQKELNSTKYELQRQTTRAEKAEAIVLEKTEDLNSKNVIIKTMAEETKQIKMDLQRSKEEAKRLLKDNRQCQKDLDSHTQMIEKLRRDLSIREDRMKMLGSQKDNVEVELNNKQLEVHALKGDIANLTKDKNVLARRVALLEERCTDAETKLEALQKNSVVQQKELDLLTKELAESQNKVRELTKQKDALSEETLRHERTIAALQGEIKVEKENCRNLEKALEKSKTFTDGLQDNIKRLEKTKERLMKDINELNTNIADLRGEITRLELNLSEAKKAEVILRQQLEEDNVKLKRLGEDERNSRKLLVESKYEYEQLQRQNIVLKKQTDILQGLNQGLDERCKKLDVIIKSLGEQIGNVKELHKQEIKNVEELSAKLKRKDDQEQLLLKNEVDMENIIVNLRRKMKNLLEEKNVQNSKLIEKEKEIRDLKGNIRVLEQEVSILDKSLNERINDVKLLKFQIVEISRRNELVNKQVEYLDATQQGLANVQNRLTEEKIKTKALEEEVQRPVNLHRWRILEGIDPEKAQLVVRNQALQKQLIHKTKELEEKEVELREKVRENRELLEQLRRRSEEGFQEQLWACKKELSARTERVKCLTGENNMFQSVCEKYRHEIMALRDQLRKYKVNEMLGSRKSRKRKTEV